MVRALLRLHDLTGPGGAYLARAETTMRSLAGQAADNPMGLPHLVCALDRYVRGATEVVVVAEPGDPAADALLDAARAAWVADLSLVRATPERGPSSEGPNPDEPSRGPGMAAPRALLDGAAAAYVCRARACSPAVADPEALRAALGAPAP